MRSWITNRALIFYLTELIRGVISFKRSYKRKGLPHVKEKLNFTEKIYSGGMLKRELYLQFTFQNHYSLLLITVNSNFHGLWKYHRLLIFFIYYLNTTNIEALSFICWISHLKNIINSCKRDNSWNFNKSKKTWAETQN